MEKRTQMAVLLIAVILGLNLMITSNMERKRQARLRLAHGDSLQTESTDRTPYTPPTRTAEPERARTPAPSPDLARSTPFPVASDPNDEIVIETPLQRFHISPAGGLVRSIALRDYETAGVPVDLVPEEFRGHPSLGLVLRTPTAVWDLSRVQFDPVAGSRPGGVVRLERGAPYTLLLRAEAEGGGAVFKRFTFYSDRYDFEVELGLERGGLLRDVESYTLEWMTSLPVTEENTKDDLHSFRAAASIGEGVVRESLRGFKDPEPVTTVGTLEWASLQSKYFTIAIMPDSAQNGTVEMVGHNDTRWLGIRITNPSPWRAAGAETYRIYAGPIVYEELKQLGVGLEALVDLGWSWIRPLSWLLLRFMHLLDNVIPNYGVIIIILSAVTKLIFWPLTEKSFRSMRSMQEIQPRMEEIKRRFKDDSQEMNRQVMALYKERKINPVGGCMPIVIQMPIFFALYSVLRSSIELRNAPFIAWIDNLAGPDVLFRLPMTLPVISNHFSVLPILMGGSMILQSKLSTPSVAATGPAAQQQLIMKWVMPIMMTFFFYQMPSGLVLYWTVNTLMSIVQQAQINRKLGPAPVAAGAAATQAEGGSKDAAAGGDDGKERRGGSATRPGRVGGKTR